MYTHHQAPEIESHIARTAGGGACVCICKCGVSPVRLTVIESRVHTIHPRTHTRKHALERTLNSEQHTKKNA